MKQTFCSPCLRFRTPQGRVHIKSTTSKPKTRARTTRKLSTVSTNILRVRPTPRSETSARPSSKPEYKSNVPNLSTTPLPSSPDDWTTQASSPNVGTFTTNKAKLTHVKIVSVKTKVINRKTVNSKHLLVQVFMAQLVEEHCISNAKALGSNPIEAP